MLFTSIATYENDPLVIKEAHHCGLPVLATYSKASDESLRILNGKTLSINEIVNIINEKNFFKQYKDISSSDELKEKSKIEFSEEVFLKKHIAIYKEYLDE